MAHPIDIESETLELDGEWYTRDELARKIRQSLENGDFNIVPTAQALEFLIQTIASLRTLAVRMTPDMLERLNQEAARQSRSVGGIVRDAIGKHLGIATPDRPGAEPSSVAHPPPMPAGRRPTDPELPKVPSKTDRAPTVEMMRTQVMEVPMIDDLKPATVAAEAPSVVVEMEEGSPATPWPSVPAEPHRSR